MLLDPITNTKRCPCCKEHKDPSAFNKSNTKTGGLKVYCRICQMAKHRVYRAIPQNVRKESAANRAYRKSLHGDYKNKDTQLRQKYGISYEDYKTMYLSQNGCCAICNEPCPERRYLNVDHCHDTGNVRGLLCLKCNFGLGIFNDSPSLLEKAIQYLNKNQPTLQAVA